MEKKTAAKTEKKAEMKSEVKAEKKSAKKTVTQTGAQEVSPRGRRVEVVGHVTSSKMDKTISVITYRMIRHEKYGKFIKKTSVFKAHDEKNVANVGDKVRIYETRPISKTKRWALSEVVEKAKV